MLGVALRFAVVGVSNTLIGVLVIYLAWRVWGWPDWIANSLGYAVGLGCGFGLNRRWTFRARDNVSRSFARYLLVCGVAFAANLVAMLSFRRVLGDATFAPHLIGVCLYTAIAFLGSHYFAFRER
jgi:putative flippase GtrA